MAVWQKYPNPFASHVLSADILARYVDGEGRLHSRRLLLKTGGSAVPSWLQSLIKAREAYVVEDSIVDPGKGMMQTCTRNLSHQRFMSIEELQIYSQSPEDSAWYGECPSHSLPSSPCVMARTLIETKATFHCTFGQWTGIASTLEGLGVAKFREHLQKSRQALMHVIERLRHSSKSGPSSSSNTALPQARF